MKKFEYLTKSFKYLPEGDILNSFGNEGWKLIGPPIWNNLYSDWVFFFIREMTT